MQLKNTTQKVLVLTLSPILGFIYFYFFWNPFNFDECESRNHEKKYYYPSGQLSEIGWIGERCMYDGLWRSYYESGELKSEVYYSHGAPHGIGNYYTESGELFYQTKSEMGFIILAKIQATDSSWFEVNNKSDSIPFLRSTNLDTMVELPRMLIRSQDPPHQPIFIKDGHIYIKFEKNYLIYDADLNDYSPTDNQPKRNTENDSTI